MPKEYRLQHPHRLRSLHEILHRINEASHQERWMAELLRERYLHRLHQEDKVAFIEKSRKIEGEGGKGR